jgi:hypothetical protein
MGENIFIPFITPVPVVTDNCNCVKLAVVNDPVPLVIICAHEYNQLPAPIVAVIVVPAPLVNVTSDESVTNE